MTIVAAFGQVAVEECETGFAILINRPDGTQVRVGGHYDRKFKAIEAARRFAEETSP